MEKSVLATGIIFRGCAKLFLMKRKKLIADMLLYNFIGTTVAVSGWIWEVLIFFIKDRRFVNRGFLYGPYLPVYGIGAVALSFLYYSWRSVGKRIPQKRHPVKESGFIFWFAMCGGSLTELCTGWLLWHGFHKKYWDYRGYPGNVAGYVCLYSALGFGIFGVVWIRWIAPRLIHAWDRLRPPMQFFIVGLSDLILATDVVFALMLPNSGTNITFL